MKTKNKKIKKNKHKLF